LPLGVFNHEKAFIIVIAVGTALASRRMYLIVGALASAVFAFISYPAATYIVALIAALVTLLAAKVRWRGVERWAFGVALAGGSIWVALGIDRFIGLTAPYFELVGKTDNGSTRDELYQVALDRALERPIFGRLFAGDVTVSINLSGEAGTVLPVHNDYLSLALGGGIVGAFLLAAAVLALNGLSFSALEVVKDSNVGSMIVVLLSSVNALALTAFANPIFMNPSSSMAAFAIMATLVSLSAGVLYSGAMNPSPEVGTSDPGADLFSSRPRHSRDLLTHQRPLHSHCGDGVTLEDVRARGTRTAFPSATGHRPEPRKS
jgi:hypothetical protein